MMDIKIERDKDGDIIRRTVVVNDTTLVIGGAYMLPEDFDGVDVLEYDGKEWHKEELPLRLPDKMDGIAVVVDHRSRIHIMGGGSRLKAHYVYESSSQLSNAYLFFKLPFPEVSLLSFFDCIHCTHAQTQTVLSHWTRIVSQVEKRTLRIPYDLMVLVWRFV